MTGSPMDGASIAQLTARLCEIEANMAVLGKLGADLRATITDRAKTRWREDGAAPTYRVDGLGSVSLPVPKAKVIIADADAFTSWCADHYGHQVTCAVEISELQPDQLGAVIDAVRQIVPTERGSVRGRVDVYPAWQKNLLDTAAIADDLALSQTDGLVIDGVRVIPAADPAKPDGPQPNGVSVRLDPQAKADAIAQAEARLADVLARGLLLTAAEPDTAAPVDAPDDAIGEPDNDPVCRCGCPQRGHKGKKHAGGCERHDGASAAGTPFCGRFKLAASAWASS